jgi:Tol biopolymer transport system component
MPEVQEVFRMATKKVGPDLGFLEGQDRRQRRRERNRKVGPFVLLVAIVAGLVTLAMVQYSANRNVSLTGDTPSPTQALPQGGISTRYVDVRTGETTPGPVVPEEDTEAFTVSADGSVMAYIAPDPSANVFRDFIYLADIDGTNLSNIRPLTKASSTRTEDLFDLKISADGSKIVYQLQPTTSREEGDLYVVDVSTGDTTRITHLEQIPSSVYAMGPTFSPDGQTVLFNAPRASDATQLVTWDLYSVPVDGGEPTLVRRDAILGSYSPDGTRIAYEKPGPGANVDLFVAMADGTNATRLVKGDLGWGSEWSPDATRIAYTDYATGDILFVVDVQTGETTTIGTYGAAFWVDDHTMITDQQ